MLLFRANVGIVEILIVFSYRRLFPVFPPPRVIGIRYRVPSFRPFDRSTRRWRFEIQEGIAKTREGEKGGSTKLWQVEDGRPPWRSVSRSSCTRYTVSRYTRGWRGDRRKTNRFTFVLVAMNASVQSTQIILPRVHCLRITRCISSSLPPPSPASSTRAERMRSG